MCDKFIIKLQCVVCKRYSDPRFGLDPCKDHFARKPCVKKDKSITLSIMATECAYCSRKKQ